MVSGNRHNVPLQGASTRSEIFQSIASDLDENRVDAALEALRALSPSECTAFHRPIRLALWVQSLNRLEDANASKEAMRRNALNALEQAKVKLLPKSAVTAAYVDTFVSNASSTWSGAVVLQEMARDLSHLQPAQLVRLLNFAVFNGMKLWARRLWELCLKDRHFVPSLHLTRQFLRCFEEAPEQTLREMKSRYLSEELEEVSALLGVYEVRILGGSVTEMLEAASNRLSVNHAKAVLSEMMWLRLGLNDLPAAMAFAESFGNEGQEAVRYVQMWSSAAAGDWANVMDLAAVPAEFGPSDELLCYKAAAAFAMGSPADGERLCLRLRKEPQTAWYIRDFAAQIDVTGRMKAEGRPLHMRNDLMPVGPGRPVVQMLWVGEQLRPSTIMSMRSFLHSGWRVQLYVYDELQDAPDGVELMNAATILPRRNIFREDARSGPHAGSLGAFSDLFRYALLSLKGGLWADTDTINLAPFEPEGAQLIATETYSPGIVGLNGSLLAARPGDPLMHLALERAHGMVNEQSMHFAKIGPTLLADLVRDFGASDYMILAPQVQNPISVADIGVLFGPPAALLAKLNGCGAVNLHLFTETWRIGNRQLTDAPNRDTSIGLLHDGLVNGAPDGLQFLDQVKQAVRRDVP